MQLTKATSHEAGEVLERGEDTFIRYGFVLDQLILVESALQVFEHPVPRVTLVSDRALDDHEGMRCAILRGPHDLPQERSRVLVSGLRQVLGHLCFRMYAGEDPPNELDHGKI